MNFPRYGRKAFRFLYFEAIEQELRLREVERCLGLRESESSPLSLSRSDMCNLHSALTNARLAHYRNPDRIVFAEKPDNAEEIEKSWGVPVVVAPDEIDAGVAAVQSGNRRFYIWLSA